MADQEGMEESIMFASAVSVIMAELEVSVVPMWSWVLFAFDTVEEPPV